MLDALKTLFENNVISEEIKTSIQEAWDNKLAESREQVTQQLREEFAQKYEHDKIVMVEAIDRMLTDRLHSEIEEFKEDRESLAEQKAKYAIAVREHSEKLKQFVFGQLNNEMSQLHEDQKAVANNFAKLEEFIIEALAKEISEFQYDKKDLAETKVRLIREAKVQFENLKQNFVKKSAGLVESVVEHTLKGEIKQLKEDIEAARRNDFGRKLFEAFASEYQTSYLNEKSETSKLLKVIDLKDVIIAETKTDLTKVKQLVESKEQEIVRSKEAQERQATMHELLSPLGKDQQEIMSELLESVQTYKLRTAYDKYLPAVIAGNAPKKKALTEAKEITGNKESNSASGSEKVAEIIDIRRLAGL